MQIDYQLRFPKINSQAHHFILEHQAARQVWKAGDPDGKMLSFSYEEPVNEEPVNLFAKMVSFSYVKPVNMFSAASRAAQNEPVNSESEHTELIGILVNCASKLFPTATSSEQ